MQNRNECKPAVRALAPTEKETVFLTNAEITEFIKDYEPHASKPHAKGTDRYAMRGVTLRWECDFPAQNYEVQLSTNAHFSAAQSFQTAETSLHLDDLFVDTDYFWQVTAHGDTESLSSPVFSFTTARTPRTIFLDGVSNARDLGGVPSTLGKIKQGMVFRTGTLDEITELGRQAAALYSIQTDLDLRYENEISHLGISPIGNTVCFVQYDGCQYAHTLDVKGAQFGISGKARQKILANTLRLFANERNYPILFHCSAGRDRTGTLAAVLLSLLGAQEREIAMDYELSFFSRGGCAGTLDHTDLVNGIRSVCAYVQSFAQGEKLAVACEKFLLHIGLTAEEIAKIRAILLV